MFCIESRCTDIYFNLAAEEYLLKRKKENYFMLWQSAPAVVMGKHQSVQREVNEDFIREKGIALARRFSGGGTVYQDEGNINLSFIETVTCPDFEYYLQRTVDFLESVGLEVYADKRMGIYVEELKVSGSAQCVHKNRVLYHCTLLYSTDLHALETALQGQVEGEEDLPAVHAIPSVRSEVANLSEYLSPMIPLKRFMRLLFHSFLEEGGIIYRFTNEDLKAIERLRQEKYMCNEWISRRDSSLRSE